MTLTDPPVEQHWHDPSCGHCPRCGHDLLPSPFNTYCPRDSIPHWTQDDGWDIPENRNMPETRTEQFSGDLLADSARDGSGERELAAIPDLAGATAHAPQDPQRVVYRVHFPQGQTLTLLPGGPRQTLGRKRPELAAFRRVSERHAEVWVDNDCDFYIRDVGTNERGSMNGTFYNEIRLDHRFEVRVEPGTQVRLADSVYLRFTRDNA